MVFVPTRPSLTPSSFFALCPLLHSSFCNPPGETIATALATAGDAAPPGTPCARFRRAAAPSGDLFLRIPWWQGCLRPVARRRVASPHTPHDTGRSCRNVYARHGTGRLRHNIRLVVSPLGADLTDLSVGKLHLGVILIHVSSGFGEQQSKPGDPRRAYAYPLGGCRCLFSRPSET